MKERSFTTTIRFACRTALSTLTIVTGAFGQSDTIRQQFFDTLAISLRADYRLCTDDSTEKPLAVLLQWRQSIDSTAADPGYPRIVRKFTDATGINPTDARPCEIVEWIRGDARRMEETIQLLAAERDSVIRLHNDSLYLKGEMLNVKQQGYDIAKIPFGLPLRALQILARNKDIPLAMNPAGIVIIDSSSYGSVLCRTALHFSKEDQYTWFELESGTCGSDSLDVWARRQMDQLAAELETRTSQPPAHIYRVGRFDIVPGRLAICKLWEFTDAFAYVGLARAGNRFYAKAIVRRK